MNKVLPFIIAFLFALPVMAEDRTPTPHEVEQIPFNNTLAAAPKIESIYNEIDTHSEIGDVEGAHGHGAHGEGKKAGLPQFNTDTFASQIFWLAIMFVILYIYFAKSALPKLSSTIEQRRATIKNDLEQADTLFAEADSIRAEYEAEMHKTQIDARKAITDAEQHLREQAEIQANEFKDKSAKAIADLEQDIDKAKNKIKGDLGAVAADIAADIIGKLTPLSVKDTDVSKAVSAHIDEAKSTTTTKKKAA